MASDRAQILITAVDQTRSAFASVKASLEGLNQATSKVNGLLAGLGASLSLAGLVHAGKAAVDLADDLNDLRQKTGVSVESLSLLKPIAEESGTSLEGLATGLKKLSTAMLEAASGAKEQAGVFARLGVSVLDAAGQMRPTEEVLLDLADAFAAMPDGAEKSALAVKLFGKSGVELIPFLNQGRSGIEELKNKFRELGLEISGDTARAADAFNDTLDTVKQALHGVTLKIAEAALPALQTLADGLVTLVSHGDAVGNTVRILSETLTAFLAVKGVGAIARLLESAGALRLALGRLLPVLAAVGVWEMGRGIVNLVQNIRDTSRAMEEMARKQEQLKGLTTALEELNATGGLSLDTRMNLAVEATDRLKAALPGASDALRQIQGAATQTGEALRKALEEETKKAAESVKQLSMAYKQFAGDAKAVLDARVSEIEANYKRQEAAAQNAHRSEAQVIRSSAQTLLAAEREKLQTVEASAREMESAWKSTFGQAVQLARASSQEVAAVERQSVEARISMFGQLESAYRSTVDRLVAEEQRHLDAARAAEESRLALKLSVEDRIRELARRGMDDLSAYQDRLRQIDEKQAAAKTALSAGNFEQARKLAEEAIQLAERTAGAVTRQVEQNGKTVTETLVSEAQASKTAIEQVKESAQIADQALKGLGDAHRKAAQDAGQGANEAKEALQSVSQELGKLREQLLGQDRLQIDVDIDSARSSLERLKALTESQTLIAKVQADTQEALASLEKLKTDAGNLELIARVQTDVSQSLAGIDEIKTKLAEAGVEIPALVSFDQPKAQLQSFVTDARLALSQPTEAVHTPEPDLSLYRQALTELLRPTSSTHTIYVQKVQMNAMGGLIQSFAHGGGVLLQSFRRVVGRVYGPGTETSDSIPALLSNREFVISAPIVKKFGEAFFETINAGLLPPLPRLAGGGSVRQAITRATLWSEGVPQSAREVVDLRFHIGNQTHTVQSSRETARNLAQALRELSRGA